MKEGKNKCQKKELQIYTRREPYPRKSGKAS